MKNNLIVLADLKSGLLSLGDYLRIISILKNFKSTNFFWFSDRKLQILAKESGLFKKCSSLNSFYKKKFDNCLIIDCISKKKNTKSILFINNIFKNKKNNKQNTFDLEKKILNFFGIDEYNIYTFKKKISQKKQVFLCWHAPKNWKIKELPKSYWKIIEKKILENSSFKVIWQNPKKNISYLFKNIKESSHVISIVSFAAHIAFFYKKKTILFSGPTDFEVSRELKNIIIVKPENFCKYRACNLPTGVSYCGCMDKINIKKVLKKIDNFLK